MKLPSEQESIRVKWFHPSGQFVQFPKDDLETSIPERIERIVRLYPDKVAVKTVYESITYSELNAKANAVANFLLANRGTKAEGIGVLVERGAIDIVVMIGILKTGKHVILLDASFPTARLKTIIQESGVVMLITDRNSFSKCRNAASGFDIPLIEFESIEPSTCANDCAVSIVPTAMAFLFFTSGSTGSPKGVIWDHRNVLHNVMLYKYAYKTDHTDRITLLAFGTANAVMNILLALVDGATLLSFDVKRESVSALANWLLEEKATVCWLSAPLFRSFCTALKEGDNFPDLRLLRLSSDTVYKDDVHLYKKLFSPNCNLINGLATSETGLLATYLISQETELAYREVPVGYPVPDTDIFLIDNKGNRVGLETEGEIVVRSDYLSPGYWNNSSLTSAKFTVDSADPTKRIYHTGDLGVILPDGCLIHKGRKDVRLKIRGYGVDLLEVEKALRSHQDVQDSVVVDRKDNSGETRLIAYFTSLAPDGPTTTELRVFLSKALADYMIPAVFVRLDHLPLTPNGKIDRKMLPEPSDDRPELSTVFAPPGNQFEQTLVQIWEEVLDVRPIGIRDKFFDLGGHSLLAVRLFAKIENSFGKQLRPATLFEAPTIEQLASILMAPDGAPSWSALVPIQPNGSRSPFFWVHGDSSSAFLSKYLAPDQPIFGLEHQSQDGKAARYRTVETIAAHYLQEIRMVQPNGPYFLGGYSFGGTVAFEIAQQLKLQQEETALLVVLDSGFPGLRDVLARSGGCPVKSENTEYVKLRLLRRLNERIQGVRKLLRKALCGVTIALGLPIPRSLRSDYILDIYDDHARGSYVPKRYDGKVFYVKSEQRPREHVEKWRELITGEMEIYQVPGGHSDIRQESFVGLWAGALQARLTESYAASFKPKGPL